MRTLERAWEEKLQELERLQRAYDTRPRPQLLTLTSAARQRILDLAQDLPALWQAPTTTNAERKQLLRFLIKDVTLTKGATTIHLAIRWQTEAVTSFDLEKPRRIYERRKTNPQLVDQVRRLAQTHRDQEIVNILNQEGVHNADGNPITLSMIRTLRRAYQIAGVFLGGAGECSMSRLILKSPWRSWTF